MSTSGGMRGRRTGDGAGRPGGSDVDPEGSARRARRPRRAVLLLVASLALVVPVGLQIHQSVADKAAASQAVADRAAADRAAAVQALAKQAVADQAAADQAVADQAEAKLAAAKQAEAKLAEAKQAAAKQAAADIEKAKAAQPKPGTGGLEPALTQAFNRARTAALAAGLDLRVNSGLRSAAEQQRLYDDAIAKYGSPAKARRWVLPPAESSHVKGLAIDVGPPAAATWLEKYGVRYGLCRRYVNEWWHFERLAPAIGQRCPALEPYAGG
jgi:D-alanyl-D-alanine carboxypeptidase